MLVATRPFGSATASEMVFPLTRFSACGRLRSVRRSHSHADSRAGRPNRSRKPSLPTCGSGSCEAEVSSGTSGKVRPGAGRLRDSVHQRFGRKPPRHRVREVVGICRVPLVGHEGRLIRAAVHDRAHQVLQIELWSMRSFVSASSSAGLTGGLDARMSSTGSMMPCPKK